MKKQIYGRVLAALLILAVSSCFVTLEGQITVEFTNPLAVDHGNPDGIGGSVSGGSYEAPMAVPGIIELKFTVDVAGNVSLDATTQSEVSENIALVNEWDNSNVGITAHSEAWGKTFTLILSSNKRMQCGSGGGGIGCQGTNQRRIDKGGVEQVYLYLVKQEGDVDVGIDFSQIGYRDINYMGGLANFEIWDHDTRYLDPNGSVWYMADIGSGEGTFDFPVDKYNLRYKSDSLIVTTSDTTGDDNPGGRFLSFTFELAPPDQKPPAILRTTPVSSDTLVEVTTDYKIQFDAPMDQTASSAAVTFDPDVTSRVDTWDSNFEGDELTISFDQLPYSTRFDVTVGTGALNTDGLPMLSEATFMFKTLPEPPLVDYTFPENLAENVPVNSPMRVEFSKSMIPDSVEKAISFNPEIANLSYVWNEDNSTIFIASDDLSPGVLYFGTVGTVATDIFGVQMTEPFIFAFTTASPTSVEENILPEVVLYPNPVSDVLQIIGMDVASVRIYSITGQMVKEVQNTVHVNVSDIPSGAYLISLTDRDHNKVTRLIVIR